MAGIFLLANFEFVSPDEYAVLKKNGVTWEANGLYVYFPIHRDTLTSEAI